MSRTESLGSPYLEIKELSHRYGSTVALKRVSLALGRNETLALIGPSGSGKSTLLAAVAGMIAPQAGEILLAGRDLLSLAPEARGLGMVFQDYALWPHMTVGQNVAFPLRARRMARAESNARVSAALARVGLRGFAERRPEQLSGGQRQRVALARAVVAEASLLLLDEPLSALDPATRASVRSELAEILRTLNLTTIIVTHDREEAFEFADRIALLVDGQVQQYGAAREIYEQPKTLAVAEFMGVNILAAELLGDNQARLKGVAATLQLPRRFAPGPAYLAIAPEQTHIVQRDNVNGNVVAGRLRKAQYRGGEYRFQVTLGGGANQHSIEARSKLAPPGESLHVQLPHDSLHVLSEAP